MMKIKKGDNVEVMAGKDRGKRGVVERVFPEEGRVVVDKINIVTKHKKPTRSGQKGERIKVSAPMSISNVMVVCPHTDKPTRIGFTMEGEKKVRVSKRSGKAL